MRIIMQTAVALLCGAMVFLAGCSSDGGHQVLEGNRECIGCHADEPKTYTVDMPRSAVESTGGVVVTTSEPTVVVCKPLFTSEDGGQYVPVFYKSYPVAGGEVRIELEEGVWAVCIDKGDASSGALVNSAASNNGEAHIKL